MSKSWINSGLLRAGSSSLEELFIAAEMGTTLPFAAWDFQTVRFGQSHGWSLDHLGCTEKQPGAILKCPEQNESKWCHKLPVKLWDVAHFGAAAFPISPGTEQCYMHLLPMCFRFFSSLQIYLASRSGIRSSYCKNGAIIFKTVSFMKSWKRDKSK